VTPIDAGVVEQLITKELHHHLGSEAQLAGSVNGEPGLWVGFRIDTDAYWLRLDRERFTHVSGRCAVVGGRRPDRTSD
jgi:two-component system osmolarity sensor histidine kinase EnvZ